MTVFSLGYVGYKWEMVSPPDFNRELVELIRRKNDLSSTAAHATLLLPGFASPVPLYYSYGPVREIPKEALLGTLRQPGHYFALVKYGEYLTLKQTLTEEGKSLRLASGASSSGDLVLVEKLQSTP